MRENNHVVSQEEIRGIKSIKDPAAIQLAKETPEGVHPYYHTIGTMGGISVRDKYASVEAMETLEKVTDTNPSTNANRFDMDSNQLH